MSVTAAECIISFMLYGSCVSMQSTRLESRRRHNNEVCFDLGLVAKNFRTGSFDQDIFGDKIQCIDEICIYTPGPRAENFLQHLRLPEGISELEQAIKHLQNYSRISWQKAAKLFVRLICLSCIRAHVESGNRYAKTIKTTMNIGRMYQNFQFMSSMELVNWLKSPSDIRETHSGLLWCFARLNEVIIDKGLTSFLSIWEEDICNAIDDEMYQTGSYMHFAANTVSYLVLPLGFGTVDVMAIGYNPRVVGALYFKVLKSTYGKNLVYDDYVKHMVMIQVTRILRSPYRHNVQHIKMNVIIKYIVSTFEEFNTPVPLELEWVNLTRL